MIVSTLVMTVSPFALTQRPRSSPVHGSDWTELQRFSVWLTRLASAAHDAYSERLRQAFMKPWFVRVNIIAIRYRSCNAPDNKPPLGAPALLRGPYGGRYAKGGTSEACEPHPLSRRERGGAGPRGDPHTHQLHPRAPGHHDRGQPRSRDQGLRAPSGRGGSADQATPHLRR